MRGLMADKVSLKEIGAGRLRVEGRLTFDTVSAALMASQKLFADYQALELDLAGVTACDSAGLALLIEWVSRALRGNCRLNFSHVPSQIMALARISDVEKLLPVLT